MNNYDMLRSDIEKNVNELVSDLDLNVDSNNEMKNRFVEWMLNNQFEQKTINNYTNAISLVSREAINDGLLSKTIYEIDNLPELDELLSKLNQNQTYLERRVSSHNTNSAAMNQYRKFIEFINSETPTEIIDENIIEQFKEYYYSNISEYKSNDEATKGIELRKEFNSESEVLQLNMAYILVKIINIMDIRMKLLIILKNIGIVLGINYIVF